MKLTKFSNICDKCGFPKNSLEKYINMFEEKNVKYRLIENDLNDKDVNVNIKCHKNFNIKMS